MEWFSFVVTVYNFAGSHLLVESRTEQFLLMIAVQSPHNSCPCFAINVLCTTLSLEVKHGRAMEQL